MGEFIRRHATALALTGYVAAALLSAVVLVWLPLSDAVLSAAFCAELLVLAGGAIVLWHRSHAGIRAMAYRDDLTSLANRRAFNRQAERFGREERGGSRSLVLFDVDGLKDLNDQCGHQAGDELLSAVGRRLEGIEGFTYRIGGDEFAVLVDRARGESAVPVLRRLEPFRSDFQSCGHNHGVSVSYGFASATPGENFTSLFRRADERLRHFKRERYGLGVLPERRSPDHSDAGQPDRESTCKEPSRGRLRLLG